MKMANRKYEHLVKPLSVGGMDMEVMKQLEMPKGAFANGPGNADNLVWLNGRDHLEGLQLMKNSLSDQETEKKEVLQRCRILNL